MKRLLPVFVLASLVSVPGQAQEFFDAGGAFTGPGSVGSNEQLFEYDDRERWKHGYIKVMPYYHGFHSFRPYNYHHVFGQSSTAQALGMSPVMPYSQQFWHRYERMADLSQGNHEPVFPAVPPAEENDHYPKPIDEASSTGRPSASLMFPHQLTSPQPGMPQSPEQYRTAQPPLQNYSQLFVPAQQPAQVSPAQFQNRQPNIYRPTLPAPGPAY